MTSRERVKKKLEFKIPDFKIFNLDDPDLEKKIAADETTDKFLTLSFSGPFEILSRKKGRLNLLREIAVNPEKTATELSLDLDRILNSISILPEKGAGFDGAWIWSDLAYKDNLFFSATFYKKYLFPVHKRLIAFLKSQDMSVIFHSDGKIDKLIPYLSQAGVEAFGPLDEYADMDIAGLNERYGAELMFFSTT